MKKLHFAFILVISFSFMVGFSNAISLEAVMPIINGWSASEASNGVKVVKDGNNYYICNSGNLSNCNKKNASLWVKYEKGMNRSDKYYVCSASSSSCDSISHNEVIYQHHETMEFDGYYICSSSSCYFTDSNTKINKDSGGSSYDTSYYVCQGEKYKCLKNNASYKYSITTDKIFRCNANASSCYSSNATTTISKKSTSSSSSSSSSSSVDFQSLANNMTAVEYLRIYVDEVQKGAQYRMNENFEKALEHDLTAAYAAEQGSKYDKDMKKYLPDIYSSLGIDFCYNGDFDEAYEYFEKALKLSNTSSIKGKYDTCKLYAKYNLSSTSRNYDQECAELYGPNSVADPAIPELGCLCINGYVRNSNHSKCILPNTNTQTNNQVISISNNGFSQEFTSAYQFAFANKITTMPTIEQANMNSPIIRAEIAKMLSNWVKGLGYTPDTSKVCKFNDISSVKGDLYTAIIESCQLGIMGQGISNYRPYDTITRGEVSTAISRILWGGQYEGGDPFYRNHMNALKNIGVLDNLNNPNTNELRGNVMVMLMRASNSDEIVNCEDPVTILACEVSPEQCPKECLEEDEEIEGGALVEEILSESNKDAEAFSGYMVSTAELVVELKSQTKFKKDFNDLTHDEIIAEIKSHIKAAESNKNKLEEIGPWKGDSSLIDECINYAELNILWLNQMIEAEGLLAKIDELKDTNRTSDLEKLREEGKIISENLDKYSKDVENKYEDIKKTGNNLIKKYKSN